MSARLKHRHGEAPVPRHAPALRREERLAGLSTLAGVHIETPLVANLSGDLHALFDSVSEDALPIYFGPLLGRLYLAGL